MATRLSHKFAIWYAAKYGQEALDESPEILAGYEEVKKVTTYTAGTYSFHFSDTSGNWFFMIRDGDSKVKYTIEKLI